MFVFRRTVTTARVLEVEIEAVEAVLPRERDRTVDEDGPVEKKINSNIAGSVPASEQLGTGQYDSVCASNNPASIGARVIHVECD